MTGIYKYWKLFLYAGLEKEEYNELLPTIREENRMLLKVFSQLAAVMFLLLYIASMLIGGFTTTNTMTYLVCAVVMLLILFCSVVILPKHPAYVMLFVNLFELVLYIFGIRISMLHAEKPAVSAVAFLLVNPLLFYDRPVRLSAMLAAVVAVFCAIVARFKAPDVMESDIWNMITFGIVAAATTMFIMSTKMRALSQSRKIEHMSQTDLLTGVKNRNHYENRLQDYPALCSANLACVYADVNGLHEMNNLYGHRKGDKMLREVAETMQRRFGPEHTYRIGGDEFVAFRMDGQKEALTQEVERIKQELSEKGYQVSFGIAVQEKAQGELSMRDLVKEAENGMYAAKREFYRQTEHDRRSR